MSVSNLTPIPLSSLYKHFLQIANKHGVKPFDSNVRDVRAQNIRFELDGKYASARYSLTSADYFGTTFNDDFLDGTLHMPNGIMEVSMRDRPLSVGQKEKLPYGIHSENYSLMFYRKPDVKFMSKEEIQEKYGKIVTDGFLLDSL